MPENRPEETSGLSEEILQNAFQQLALHSQKKRNFSRLASVPIVRKWIERHEDSNVEDLLTSALARCFATQVELGPLHGQLNDALHEARRIAVIERDLGGAGKASGVLTVSFCNFENQN